MMNSEVTNPIDDYMNKSNDIILKLVVFMSHGRQPLYSTKIFFTTTPLVRNT